VDVISDRDRLLRLENYPGMIPEESRVLRQFIHRHGALFDEFRFNVRIGEGVELGADFDEKLRRAWTQWTKARPDTIGFKHPNDATIIEVKWDFTNEGVWQILAYRDLYVAAFPAHVVRLVGLGTFATPTARNLAASNGIQLHLYALTPGAVDIDEQAAER
jgi:hypothetical protein